MNTPIIITAIICVTVLIIVCIVQYVEYKLKNNNELRKVKDALNSVHNEIEINNRWSDIYSNQIDDIIKAIKELKKQSDNV